jgi:hypothetical protein
VIALDVPRHGESDQDLAAAIPGAELVRIPDRGHLGTVTDPLCKGKVLAFLEARRPTGGLEAPA